MTPTPSGTPVPVEQAPQGTQQAPEQSQQQAAPLAQQSPQPAAENPQAQQQPDAAALQQRLAELEARYKQTEESARYHQSQASRLQQALQVAAGGNAPQADPLKPYMDRLMNELPELTESAARALAQRDYQTEQRFNTLQGAVMAQGQIPSVMQQLYAQAPHLFANQQVVNEIETSLRQQAAQDPRYVNAEYAFNVGAIAHARAQMTGNRQQPFQPVQQPQQPTPNFPSQFGPINGHQPQSPVQAQPSLPAGVEQLRAQERAYVNQRFNIQPQPGNPS